MDMSVSASVPSNLNVVAQSGGGRGPTSADSHDGHGALGSIDQAIVIDPERRPHSAQDYRAPLASSERSRPTVLTKRPTGASLLNERSDNLAEDSRKHDSIASSASGGGGVNTGKYTASDVSSPMNAVPLPSGFDFKSSSNQSKDMTSNKADRRKTKTFWGGLGRNDKSSSSPSKAGDANAGAGNPRPVFGVPLKEAVEASRIRPGLELPAVVYRCVEYLESKNAESEEGIFRLSGSTNVIKNLRERFNNEGDVNLLAIHDYVDPNAVAGLLKSFLRELPGHVLTREMHSEFLQIIGEFLNSLEIARKCIPSSKTSSFL